MNETIVQRVLEYLHLKPEGVLLGSIGATFSLLFRAVGFSWRMGILVVASGALLSGYAMPALEEATGWGQGLITLTTFVLGVLAKDILSKLVDASPTLATAMIGRLRKTIQPTESENERARDLPEQ